MTHALWIGVHCPALPLIAAGGAEVSARALAVHDGSHRLFQVSARAQRSGLRPGQRLGDALAVLPMLDIRARNPGLERLLLEQIALAAYGHSHQVVLVEPDTVLLEAAGSRRLRGSITALLDMLRDQLQHQDLPVGTGSAPVPAAAALLARTGDHVSGLDQLGQVLDSLPLDCLALDPDQCRALAGCGLRRLGDFMRLPAAERTRRFGSGLNGRFRQLYGHQPTPLKSWQPPQHHHWKLTLPSATIDARALLFVLRRAVDHLGGWLRARDHALVRLRIVLEREDGGAAVRFATGLSRPGFDRDRLLELLALKLESLSLPAPVTGLAASAETTAEHRPPQADLFSGHNRTDAWPALIDRLTARLGQDGLCGLAACADHRPEKAWAWTAPGVPTPCPDMTRARRPGWLLAEPRRCRREQLVLEEGPERIEGGWWDGHDCRRDYWVARDHHGRRLWVFQEYKPRRGWFLHGIFG